MTKELIIAKLHFTGPLHLSKGKPNNYEDSDEILRSDTLKSAMYAVGLQIFGESVVNKQDFLEKFQISSAFPFCGADLFFPKPMIRLPFKSDKGDDDTTFAKDLKKLKYLNQLGFEAALNADDSQKIEDILRRGGEDIFKKVIQQRVSIDAETHESVPFYIEKMYFKESAGLYFIIQFEESLKETLKEVINALGESGVGTNKNLGCGTFQFDGFETITLNVPDSTECRWMNLSLYCPNKAEIDDNTEGGVLSRSDYSLIKRGGWLASPENEEHLTLRKKSIFMFSEGSVFDSKVAPKGKIVNLRPKEYAHIHDVWRDGTSIFLPVK